MFQMLLVLALVAAVCAGVPSLLIACANGKIALPHWLPGLLAFCRAHGWPVRFFSAEALERLEGEFTGSPFVKRTVGVDNVCERSAALASGGALIGKKYVFGGVTLAMAQKPYEMDWTW